MKLIKCCFALPGAAPPPGTPETKETKETKDTQSNSTDEKIEQLLVVNLQKAVNEKRWSNVEELVRNHPFLAQRKIKFKSKLYRQVQQEGIAVMAILDDGQVDCADATSACSALVEKYPSSILAVFYEGGSSQTIALTRAVSLGWTAVVLTMLNVKKELVLAACQAAGQDGCLPLHTSAMSKENSKAEIVEALLAVNPSAASVCDHSRWNRYPLSYAIIHECPLEIVEMLVATNATIIEYTKPGHTESSNLFRVLKQALLCNEGADEKEGKEENNAKAEKHKVKRLYYNELQRRWLDSVARRNVSSERLLNIHLSIAEDLFSELDKMNTLQREKRWRTFLLATKRIPLSNVSEAVSKTLRSKIIVQACAWCPPLFVLEELIVKWGADPRVPMVNSYDGVETYALHNALENCTGVRGRMSDDALLLLITDDVLQKRDAKTGDTCLHMLMKGAVALPYKWNDRHGKYIVPEPPSSRSPALVLRFAEAAKSMGWPSNNDDHTPLWGMLCRCDFSATGPEEAYTDKYVRRHWQFAHDMMLMVLKINPSMAVDPMRLQIKVNGRRHPYVVYPLQFVSNFQNRNFWTNQRQHSKYQGVVPMYFKQTLWRFMTAQMMDEDVLVQQAIIADMFDEAFSLLESVERTVGIHHRANPNILPLHYAIVHGAPSALIEALINAKGGSQMLCVGVNVVDNGRFLFIGQPQKSDLPLHLVLDDCHDRMERWCSSCAKVLTVLEAYEKYPEYTGHTGDVGQYELAISGISTKTKVVLPGVGCPLQMEFARIGRWCDRGSDLRTGPRWNVVRKVLSLHPASVKLIRHLYYDQSSDRPGVAAVDIQSASQYLMKNTSCFEILPLHRALSLGAPEDVVLLLLKLDPNAVHVLSPGCDNVLHLAVSNSFHSHVVVQQLLLVSTRLASVRATHGFLLPVQTAMRCLIRAHALLHGGNVSNVDIFNGDKVMWKSCSATDIKRYESRCFVGRACFDTSTEADAAPLTVFLPPNCMYPGTPIVDSVHDSLLPVLPVHLVRYLLDYLEDDIGSHFFEGMIHARVMEQCSDGCLEYVERFEENNVNDDASACHQLSDIQQIRELRVNRCRELIRVVGVLTVANPPAMYESCLASGDELKYIEVLRRTMVSVRAISLLPALGVVEGKEGKDVGVETKSEVTELFVPLGRRPFSFDVEVTHLSVEAHCLCGLEGNKSNSSSISVPGYTSKGFMLGYLSTVIQSSLAQQLEESRLQTTLLRDVYINTRAGHKGMYGAALNGIKVQPQYAPFMQRAQQLAKSIKSRGRRRDSFTEASVQKSGESIHALYASAHSVASRYDVLLEKLSQRTGATYMRVSMKKPLRVLEKAMVAQAMGKSGGSTSTPWDTSCVLDVVRGALSFSTMNEMLMCLELLAATTTDVQGLKECRLRGWDAVAAGISEKLDIVRIKNRFNEPTSGGWADAMVNFRFAAGPEGSMESHVCEIQFVHAQMMLVRKQMGAHYQYEQFRSARELMEATGNVDIANEIDEEADRIDAKQPTQQTHGLEDRVNVLEGQVERLMAENSKLWATVVELQNK